MFPNTTRTTAQRHIICKYREVKNSHRGLWEGVDYLSMLYQMDEVEKRERERAKERKRAKHTHTKLKMVDLRACASEFMITWSKS